MRFVKPASDATDWRADGPETQDIHLADNRIEGFATKVADLHQADK